MRRGRRHPLVAAQGWDVTAVDFADAALERVAQHAAEAGVADRVKTHRIDLRTFKPDGETWELVTSHFVHLPDGGMLDLTRRLNSAVAPGGTLLVVGHDAGDLATELRHGHQSSMHTAEALLPALDDQWEIEICESRPRTQADPQTGEDIVIADTVLRVRPSRRRSLQRHTTSPGNRPTAPCWKLQPQQPNMTVAH